MVDSPILEAAVESGLREHSFDNAPYNDLEQPALPEKSGSNVTPDASNLVRATPFDLT